MAPTNPIPKPRIVRKREQHNPFFKPQKRGPLAPTTANKPDNRVGKDYDFVKPAFTSYSSTEKMRSGRTGTRLVTKMVPAPAQLMAPRDTDTAAIHKPLMDLMAKEKAEKEAEEKRKEEEENDCNSLFESDDEGNDHDSIFGSDGDGEDSGDTEDTLGSTMDIQVLSDENLKYRERKLKAWVKRI